MEKDLNYLEDLETNKYDLDSSLEKQAYIYMRYQELFWEKNQEKDELKLEIDLSKNKLKEVEAELYLKYKNLRVDGKVPTEKFVDSRVIIDPLRKAVFEELVKLQKKYNKVNYKCGVLESAVRSFEHRKKALEKLCELYIAGYYSQPAPKNIRKKLNNKED